MLRTADEPIVRPPVRGTRQPTARIKAYETEHRILNSLQLVASLLRDSLRTASCEVSRQEIHVAHQRIMSVISLQRELYRNKGDVDLDKHLVRIARHIETALVEKERPLRIAVRCRTAKVDAATATALGLVVTELLINTIKHAYPDDAGGTIRLSFAGDRENWRLVVADDGVGAMNAPFRGAGSDLVAALAMQLDARLMIHTRTSGYRTELVRPATWLAPER